MFYFITQSKNFITALNLKDLFLKLKSQNISKPDWNSEYLKHLFSQGFMGYPKLLFETVYQNIYRIPIGYKLSNKINAMGYYLEREWSLKNLDSNIPNPKTCSLKTAVEYIDFYLTQSIQKSLSNSQNNNIGVELSGGLDSSLIAGILNKLKVDIDSDLDFNLEAFSNRVPNTKDTIKNGEAYLYDESQWSDAVSKYLNIHLNKIQGEDKYKSYFSSILKSASENLLEPSIVLFPLLNHFIYQSAQSKNITTLFSGFGGDEILSHSGKLSLNNWKKNKNFLRYYYERICAKKNNFRLDKNTIPFAPDSEYKTYFNHDLKLHFPNQYPNSPQYLPEHMEWLIENQGSLHWQMRILTSQQMAKFYGLDLILPLTDSNLMRFVYQLPLDYKYRHGIQRFLMRKILSQYYPKYIVNRKDKAGATAPGAWNSLVKSLPKLWLDMFSNNNHSSDILGEIINIPKLQKRFEQGIILDRSLIRIAVQMIMFEYLQYSRALSI